MEKEERYVINGGERIPYDKKALEESIYEAAKNVRKGFRIRAGEFADLVTNFLDAHYWNFGQIPNMSNVQDVTESVLEASGYQFIARSYSALREQKLREPKQEK
jgi:hypothetical protein